VLLHLAVKAFTPQQLPFPVMHIDTGQNFPEVLEFRDALTASLGVRLIVAKVQDTIDQGKVRPRPDGLAQPPPDRDAAATPSPTTASTPPSAARAATRTRPAPRSGSCPSATPSASGTPASSARTVAALPGQGQPRRDLRAFPLSDWTELDVWQYIERERWRCPRSTSPTSATSCCATACGWPSGVGGAARRRDVERAWCAFAPSATPTAPAPSTRRPTTPRRDHRRGRQRQRLRARRHARRRPFSETAMEDRKREGYF
jgi:sulfate adenylyltransferase subunit 2